MNICSMDSRVKFFSNEMWILNFSHIFNTDFYPNKIWILKFSHIFNTDFYPTDLKRCRGIVFTHSVWIGGRREKVCPGCISETVRCRKLILGRDIG